MRAKTNEIPRVREAGNYPQPAKQTLDRLGIARPTFCRWVDLYQHFGEGALEDRRPGSRRAWNKIPGKVQEQILDMALERCELSPRELALKASGCDKVHVLHRTMALAMLLASELTIWPIRI